jgi:hypothetical protein
MGVDGGAAGVPALPGILPLLSGSAGVGTGALQDRMVAAICSIRGLSASRWAFRESASALYAATAPAFVVSTEAPRALCAAMLAPSD